MPIFRDKDDLEYFCSLVNKYAEQQKVTIFAYSLCESCYHMLVRSERGNFNDISVFLRLVGGMYGRFFNRKSLTVYNKPRHGVIFAAKFESTPINDVDEVKKYIVDIHKEAEMDFDKLKDYEYCSYGKYLNNEKLKEKGIKIKTSYLKDISKEDFLKMHNVEFNEEDKGIDIHQGDYFMSYGIFVRKNNSK